MGEGNKRDYCHPNRMENHWFCATKDEREDF